MELEGFYYGMDMDEKKIASMEYEKIVFHSIPYNESNYVSVSYNESNKQFTHATFYCSLV